MPSLRSFVFAVLASAALSACGGGQVSSSPPPPVELDTTLGPGDVFDVRVYGEEALSNTFRISADGKIDFPFIGEVEVEGLEPETAGTLIAQQLQDGGYLVSPQVSVFVQEYQSKRVTIVGAVENPGTFSIAPGLTVVHAIQQAGGATALAAENNTVVTRRVEGDLRRFRVRVRDISRGQSEDFPMQAGDIVYVPERIF